MVAAKDKCVPGGEVWLLGKINVLLRGRAVSGNEMHS